MSYKLLGKVVDGYLSNTSAEEEPMPSHVSLPVQKSLSLQVIPLEV